LGFKANFSKMNIFDSYYQKYDEWFEKPFGRSAYDLEVQCLNKIIGSFDRGLEIGVGTGRFAQKLNVKYGVDISFNMLKVAKSRNIVVLRSKGEQLPFKNSVFDLVLIVVSLCFVKEPFLVLKESYRVLRGDGKLVLGLILWDSPWAQFYRNKKDHPLYQKAFFYSYYEICAMLELSKFKINKVLTTLFEKPQDEQPIKNFEIKEGFHKEGGFVCISSSKV